MRASGPPPPHPSQRRVRPPPYPSRPERVTVRTRGIDCACHVWSPAAPPDDPDGSPPSRYNHPALRGVRPRAAVVVFHGLGGHGLFPTVRYLAELLSANQYAVYGLDLPGHGVSPGQRGLIVKAEDVVRDGVAVTLYAKRCHPDLPVFLAGSSMGGAVALSVSHEFELMQGGGGSDRGGGEGDSVVSGMVLIAPMVSITVPRWQRRVLRGLNAVAPKRALFPPAEDATELQFRDPVRRSEVEADGASYKGSLRVASALSCLTLTRRVNKCIGSVRTPFLCLIGSRDVVVDNDAVREELMDLAPVADKTLREYDALHGLLCEAQPLRGRIEDDILDWLFERTDAGVARHGISVGGAAGTAAAVATPGGGFGAGQRGPGGAQQPRGSGPASPSVWRTPATARRGEEGGVATCDESVLSALEDALFQ